MIFAQPCLNLELVFKKHFQTNSTICTFMSVLHYSLFLKSINKLNQCHQ